MTYDLALLGGTLVSPAGRRRAHVYVTGERIAAVTSDRFDAARVVDASGLYLLPGAIDGHVHFMDPPETDREDFVHGSAAAAAGGVTAVIEHTHTDPVRSPEELRKKAGYLRDRSVVDFGLAAHVWADRIDRLGDLWRAGATFFKLFTCTTHGIPGQTHAQMLRAFRQCAELGSPALVHCEDEAITAENAEALKAAGVTGGELLPLWRSREAELVAVGAVSLLARLTGARVIIAHTSHAEAVDLAAAQRAAGADVWIETCPHYLYLFEDEVLREGGFRKFTPPARARSRWEQAEMWRRVAGGPVTHISADHAPSTRAHKEQPLARAPWGLPGVETTLPLLLRGVADGHLSLERVVELVSAVPARLYGLYPRKGVIRPGADADLALVDLQAQKRLRDEDVVSKAGWTPYAGMELRGLPVQTYVRGRLVAEQGKPVAEPGWGRFLPGPGSRIREVEA